MTLEELQIDSTKRLIKFHKDQVLYWLDRIDEPAADKCMTVSANELIRLVEVLKELQDGK